MSHYSFSSTNLDDEMFTYEYFQHPDICRLCWTKDASIDLFSRRMDEPFSLEEQQLVQKIQDCLGLDLRPGAETFPSKVCATCSGHIETFYMFKRFCHESDKSLKEIFERHTSELPADFSTDVKIESLTETPEEEVFVTLEDVTNCLENTVESVTENKISESVNANQNPDSLANNTTIGTIVQNMEPNRSENKSKNATDKNTDSQNVRPKRKASRRLGTTSQLNHDNLPVGNKSTKKVKRNKHNSKTLNKDPSNTLPEFCIECKSIFKDLRQLSIHNRNVHGIEDDGMSYKCYGCDKKCSSKKNRIRHETAYCRGLKDGYKCFLCNRFLPYRQILQRHMKEHNNKGVVKVPENIFKCKKCGKSFKTRQKLIAHKSVHSPKEYVCETCGRVFTRPDYLYIHNLIHAGVKRHRCPHCPYRATQRSSLVLHLRTHSGDRPYQCDMCPLRCISKSSLIAHLRRHLGHTSFQCTICPKTFGYKESLKVHIVNVHECAVSYSCQYCKLSYRRKTSLNRHIRTKHHNEKDTKNKIKSDCKVKKEIANVDTETKE